jgi:hypothetical protein
MHLKNASDTMRAAAHRPFGGSPMTAVKTADKS